MLPQDFQNPYTLRGALPGPNVVIVGSIHGNERCGGELLPVLSTIELLSGTLTLLLGNPRAFAQNVRYTEYDLNRMFLSEDCYTSAQKTSYEYQRAQEIKNVLHSSDILLDIHASTSPVSPPFIICEQSGLALARRLPMKRVVTGFDTIQPGGTDYYMNLKGGVGICIECGYLKEASTLAAARECAYSLLQSLGMISPLLQRIYEEPQEVFQLSSQYFTTMNFQPTGSRADFEKVEAGTCLGWDGESPILAETCAVVLFQRACEGRNEEAFLTAKKLAGNNAL